MFEKIVNEWHQSAFAGSVCFISTTHGFI